jgi:hemerythrin-like domain-containing protein
VAPLGFGPATGGAFFFPQARAAQRRRHGNVKSEDYGGRVHPDTPAAPEDPVESMLGFHRRIERNLAILGRVAGHVEAHGVDAEASAEAAALVHFFGELLPLHHADEEHDLVPLVQGRIALAAEREGFLETRRRLEADHRELRETWKRLRTPLNAIGEGMSRRLPAGLVQYFRALQALHISSEEGVLHRAARRWLRPADRMALARRMAGRRARRHASVTPLPRN